MEKNSLQDEYGAILEENSRFKQLIHQLREELRSHEKEINETERKLNEMSGSPNDIFQPQSKIRKYRNILRNLEKFTTKFDVNVQRNIDCRENLAHLLKLRDTAQNIVQKLDHQLAEQGAVMEELESDFTDLFNQRSKAENQTLKMKENLEDATYQFSKKQMILRTHIAHDAKLQKFMRTKLQKIILSIQEKDSKTKERTKPVETYLQSYNELVEANRESNLSQIGLAFTTNKRTNLVLMNYITDLHAQRNMLEISTEKIKNDILMLEQARLHEEDGMNQLKDLESELENHISLGDSLEEQRRVVQRAVDQLTASIRGLLDDGSVTVAADNIALCIGKLVENIHNLLIQANSETDEQSLQLANFALLPDIDTPTNSMSDIESAVEKEHSRTSSGSSFRSTASSRK